MPEFIFRYTERRATASEGGRSRSCARFGPALAALLLAACARPELYVAGARPPSAYVVGPGGGYEGVELGQMRFAPDLCPRGGRRDGGELLDVDDFINFWREQGAEPRVAAQRADLTIVEASPGTARPVRFRVAVLPTAEAAGQELHRALLEHGLGAWWVRRANLAVLVAAPSAVDDIVVFTAKTKLACWGSLNVAGHDDVYVVPGGRFEL